MKQSRKTFNQKIKITLSLSRSALAVIDRVRAKRLEKGASRREIQHSTLVEEAIEMLKRKEDI
jgi:hypothetical protein